MIHWKRGTVFLTSLFVCLCILLPVRVSAEMYGESDYFGGSFYLLDQSHTLQLQQATVTYESSDGYARWARATYSGTESNLLKVQGMTPGNILVGETKILLEASLTTVLADKVYQQIPSVSIDADAPDGISVGIYEISHEAGAIKCWIKVEFDAYYCTRESIDIPVRITIDQGLNFGQTDTSIVGLHNGISYWIELGGDWAGICTEYTDIRDVPSVDGEFARQSQQIIDDLEYNTEATYNIGNNIVSALETNINNLINKLDTWFTSLSSTITSRFSELYSNLNLNFQNLLNQNSDEHEETINGFDTSTTDSVNTEFSSGLSEYEEAESSLFEMATTETDKNSFYDFSSIPAVLTGLSFVSSIMTGFFEAMGGMSGIGVVLSVLMSVVLVTVIMGSHRYFVSSGNAETPEVYRDSGAPRLEAKGVKR